MKNEFKIFEKDLRSLNRKLNKLSFLDKQGASVLVQRFATKTESDIVRDSPIDTGNLRQNIHTKVNDKEALVESIALSKTNPKTDYAIFQEFGTIFRKPKPYFYPNIYKNLLILENRLKSAIKKALK